MSKPWDAPPFPVRGDETDDATYAAVGRFLSAWEELEESLGILHAKFTGQPSPEAEWRYGNGRTFADRLFSLAEAASLFFVKTPSQSLEAEWCCLHKQASGFSDRRNEIAHGIVRPIVWLDHTFGPPYQRAPESAFQFCLVPPFYTFRKFDNVSFRPKYAYTSAEILPLERSLRNAVRCAMQFQPKVQPPPTI